MMETRNKAETVSSQTAYDVATVQRLAEERQVRDAVEARIAAARRNGGEA